MGKLSVLSDQGKGGPNGDAAPQRDTVSKVRAVRHYLRPINIRFHPGRSRLSRRRAGSPYLRDTRGCRHTCRYADYMPSLHASNSWQKDNYSFFKWQLVFLLFCLNGQQEYSNGQKHSPVYVAYLVSKSDLRYSFLTQKCHSLYPNEIVQFF